MPSHVNDGRAVGMPTGVSVGGALGVMLGPHHGAADCSVMLCLLGVNVGDADGTNEMNAVGTASLRAEVCTNADLRAARSVCSGMLEGRRNHVVSE